MLSLVTLVGATGKGIFLTTSALYFTRAVDLSVMQVGIGLSIAGVASAFLGFFCGHLADRYGPRRLYTSALLVGTVSTFGFLLADGFWSFLVVATFTTSAIATIAIVRGPIVNYIAQVRPQAVTNIGIAVGAVVAGWAAQLDTLTAWRWAAVANAVCLLVAAVLSVGLPKVAPIPRTTDGPRWIALHDPPYVALSLMDGLMSIQYRVLTVAVPLWIVEFTTAPRWLISAAVIINTLVIIFFQVRASRNIVNPRRAGYAMRRAGATFFMSCVVLAAAAGMPTLIAAGLILGGIVVHSVAELWHASGGFEASNVLAPPHAIGQYLGVFGFGLAIAESLGPALLTFLCIELGRPGWFLLGMIFLAAGVAVPPIINWAERTRHRYNRMVDGTHVVRSPEPAGTASL
jgi:MFS family permease